PLLKDARPAVRLRAAVGLAGAYDTEAVPVLIGLLADAPPRQRQAAEACLAGLAGEWALATPQGDDAISGRLPRRGWAAGQAAGGRRGRRAGGVPPPHPHGRRVRAGPRPPPPARRRGNRGPREGRGGVDHAGSPCRPAVAKGRGAPRPAGGPAAGPRTGGG